MRWKFYSNSILCGDGSYDFECNFIKFLNNVDIAVKYTHTWKVPVPKWWRIEIWLLFLVDVLFNTLKKFFTFHYWSGEKSYAAISYRTTFLNYQLNLKLWMVTSKFVINNLISWISSFLSCNPAYFLDVCCVELPSCYLILL